MSDSLSYDAVEQNGEENKQDAVNLALSVAMTNEAYVDAVAAAFDQIKENNTINRIWKKDPTVWSSDPVEILDRLGWLDLPESMVDVVRRIYDLAYEVTRSGFTHVLLLGMGGSSLAPEMFMKTFGGEGLTLHVVDSTDADFVQSYYHQLDLQKTLFIVATKSGGTVETLSFFKYFFNKLVLLVGMEKAGQHFVGITDPGSKLEAVANFYDFRALFLNDPNIGGRFSALSYFGMMPATLVGVDVNRLLKRADEAATSCRKMKPEANVGVHLGVLLGELAKLGRDKLTLVTSEQISSFGDWVEQLVAESTGKNGQGILPVVGEPLGSADLYGEDRVFVHLRLHGDDSYDEQLADLAEAGHPVITMFLRDLYDLGQQIFLWEMATSVAGERLKIHPFNQPNVESAKLGAKAMLRQFGESGKLPEGETESPSADALNTFLADLKPGEYVSIHAYIQPTPAASAMLATLQAQIRDKYKAATTIGYGPRFLHSTGQLHKGDAGNGKFVQLVSDAKNDINIPDTAGEPASTTTFDVLKKAQALGDADALKSAKRRLIRFDLGQNVMGGIQKLIG